MAITKKDTTIMKFSIIIPCYNEASNLINLLDNLSPIISRDDTEVILVENGSTDNSKDLFKTTIEQHFPQVTTVYVNTNKGYGYGILQGVQVATGDYIGWIHADLQVDASILLKFFDYAKSNPTKTFFLKGRRSNRHLIEYFFSFGMSCFESLLFHKIMFEVMAMPCLIPSHLLKNYYSSIPIDFSIDIFVYALAVYNDIEVIHIPVKMQDRTAGISSWNTGIIARIKQSHKMIQSSIIIKKEISKIITPEELS